MVNISRNAGSIRFVCGKVTFHPPARLKDGKN